MQMMKFIFVLFKDLVSQRCGHHTRDAFNRVMVWSLMAMFEGEHPSYCPNGHFYDRDTPEGRLAREPLCGRGSEQFRAVLFANCGDLEHHWQGFGLENPGATAAGPCMFCKCMSSTRRYFDYTDTAAWIPTIYTKESWRTHHPNPSRLYLLPFLSIMNQVPDWMHMQHLGNYQRIFGSVLHVLVYQVLLGNPTDNLAQVVSELKAFWRISKEKSISDIRLAMFCDPSKPQDAYPYLKGEAAEVKHILGGLHEVWKNHSAAAVERMEAGNPRIPVYGQIRLLLQFLHNMESVLDAHNPVMFPKLPDAAIREFQMNGNNAHTLITSIAHHYREVESLMLFNTTIKTHYLKHIILRAAYQNPRMGMCYMFEDYMQHMKRMIARCCKVAGPRRLSQRIALRQRLVMHFLSGGSCEF